MVSSLATHFHMIVITLIGMFPKGPMRKIRLISMRRFILRVALQYLWMFVADSISCIRDRGQARGLSSIPSSSPELELFRSMRLYPT